MPENATTDNFYALGFSLTPNIGPMKFQKIINTFGSAKTAWEAPIEEYLGRGLPDDIIGIIEKHRPATNLDHEWEKLKKLKMDFISQNNSAYPDILKQIHNPPFGLFVRGKMPEYDMAIAIVGTRKPTIYGMNSAKLIADELSGRKILITSGLALGIDTIAHKTALENESQSIAVLGGGIDDNSLYPTVNRKLAQSIADGFGAVVSEYPPSTPALTSHFPARNRIISGLSQATIVIEGELDSGSLITARFALEQNREIFAVPGNITNSKASGPNALIKQGAHPLTSPDDIFEILNIGRTKKERKAKKIFPSSPEERKILEILSDDPVHLDAIIQTLKLDTKIINSTLTIMEMKGLVRHIGSGQYIKI